MVLVQHKIMRLRLTEQAANELGKIFTDYIKRKLKEKIYPYGNPVRGSGDKIASKKLYNSIGYKVVPEKQEDNQVSYVIEFQYLDYFDYVNRGRQPGSYLGRKGIDALLQWISLRRIKPQGYKGRGRYPVKNKLSLAFAIRQNIFKYGIRPAGVIDKTYDSLEDFFSRPPRELNDEMRVVFQRIEEDINNLIENIIVKPESTKEE